MVFHNTVSLGWCSIGLTNLLSFESLSEGRLIPFQAFSAMSKVFIVLFKQTIDQSFAVTRAFLVDFLLFKSQSLHESEV